MVKIIGHRGAAGLEPENTMRSFRRALDEGCHMLEFDIHLTSDGVPVVIHDTTVDRTTDGSGRVIDLTCEEIASLDAGKGERIPTLESVLGGFWGRISLNIELKGDDTAEPVYLMLRDYTERNGRAEVLVSSFSPVNIKEFADLGTGIPTAVLVDHSPWGSEEFADLLGCCAIHPNHEYLSRDFVERCKESGLRVNTWTVDTPAAARRCLSMGVDGLITNRPDILGKII